MKDYLIVDNYFSNPKEIKYWAFKQTFYNKENHPYKESLGGFSGFRTNYINNLDEHKFNYFINNLLKGSELFYEQDFTEFKAWLSFSYTLENIKLPDFHKDETSLIQEDMKFKKRLAGVVYLNEDAEKEAGTIIINDNKELLIENKFNRLILYPPDKVHSVAKSFGKTKEDARFVFTILIYLE